MDSYKDDARIIALKKTISGGLIWIALAAFLIAIVLITSIRVGHIKGTEVGIMLNKMNGKMTVLSQSGAKIYNGITNDFYVLDKTMQNLVMTERKGTGDRSGRDDLKIKTKDGSDVYVDLKVQYKIKADMADIVVTKSGPGENYKKKWARDYVRTTCRNYLGELTTEEFYDSSKREEKIYTAQKEANKMINPYGIHIDVIAIPQKPHFYKEYEAMIKKKKLADQGVLEERSKALAAQQKQITLIVIETKKKEVEVKRFEGDVEQKIIEAKAQAEKKEKEADAYFDRVTIGADATLYEMEKKAEAILAEKKAEAKGIEALKTALEGEGGRNMVKLEYAKKLKDITITGKPFTIQSNIERFEHLQAPPASVGSGIVKIDKKIDQE
jgi:regulator of protease activity HflC (stomatin/prohibitin superfamily)